MWSHWAKPWSHLIGSTKTCDLIEPNHGAIWLVQPNTWSHWALPRSHLIDPTKTCDLIEPNQGAIWLVQPKHVIPLSPTKEPSDWFNPNTWSHWAQPRSHLIGPTQIRDLIQPDQQSYLIGLTRRRDLIQPDNGAIWLIQPNKWSHYTWSNSAWPRSHLIGPTQTRDLIEPDYVLLSAALTEDNWGELAVIYKGICHASLISSPFIFPPPPLPHHGVMSSQLASNQGFWITQTQFGLLNYRHYPNSNLLEVALATEQKLKKC